MEKTDDPYVVLGVNDDASSADIKKAYRRLALKYHPDKQTGDDQQRQQASSQFSKVAAAYEILSDDERRKQFDLQKKYGTIGDGKIYREATPSGTTTATSCSSPQQRGYTTRNTTTSTSMPSNDGAETFFSTGPIPVDQAGNFHDPNEVFRRFFGKDFDPSSLDSPVKMTVVGPDGQPRTTVVSPGKSPTVVSPSSSTTSSPTKSPRKSGFRRVTNKSSVPKGMPTSMPLEAGNDGRHPVSMSSSTRQVQHPDGSIQTITEKTTTYSDGSTSTSRSSSRSNGGPKGLVTQKSPNKAPKGLVSQSSPTRRVRYTSTVQA